MRCCVSISYPVYSSKTVLIIFIGGFLLAGFSGVDFVCSVSTHSSVASWVNDRKHVLILMFYTSVCCVSLVLFLLSYTLVNAASFIFGYSASKNLGDC